MANLSFDTMCLFVDQMHPKVIRIHPRFYRLFSEISEGVLWRNTDRASLTQGLLGEYKSIPLYQDKDVPENPGWIFTEE